MLVDDLDADLDDRGVRVRRVGSAHRRRRSRGASRSSQPRNIISSPEASSRQRCVVVGDAEVGLVAQVADPRVGLGGEVLGDRRVRVAVVDDDQSSSRRRSGPARCRRSRTAASGSPQKGTKISMRVGTAGLALSRGSGRRVAGRPARGSPRGRARGAAARPPRRACGCAPRAGRARSCAGGVRISSTSEATKNSRLAGTWRPSSVGGPLQQGREERHDERRRRRSRTR